MASLFPTRPGSWTRVGQGLVKGWSPGAPAFLLGPGSFPISYINSVESGVEGVFRFRTYKSKSFRKKNSTHSERGEERGK